MPNHASRYVCSFVLQFWLLSLVASQSSTNCNPLTADCPPNPALGTRIEVDFRDGIGAFTPVGGSKIPTDQDLGAIFAIRGEADTSTIIFPKYIFFGQLTFAMRCAPGIGIVTSVVLRSDSRDAIDMQFLGGDNANYQSNYFSKGDTSGPGHAAYHTVAQPADIFHTYSVAWTPKEIVWTLDGFPVRTLAYSDANNVDAFPQTPMQLDIGVWVAGRQGASQGTIDWAGGYADFIKGPFNAYLKNVSLVDFSNGQFSAAQYVYGDRSGKLGSIKVIQSNDTGSPSSTSSITSSATSSPTGISKPSQNDPSPSGGSNGLGAGPIAGIVVVIVVLLLLMVIAIIYVRRLRAKKAGGDATNNIPYPKGQEELQSSTVSELDSQVMPIWLAAIFKRHPSNNNAPISEMQATEERTQRYKLDGSKSGGF